MASKYYKAYSYLKPYLKIGGTKKSDKIKEAVGIKKKFEAVEGKATKSLEEGKAIIAKNKFSGLSRSDLVDQAKTLRDTKRGKKDADKFVKETLKKDFNKGGRVGFKKGTGRSGVPAMDIKSTPTKKLSEKQKKIARLAGDPQKIDKPDFAKLRNKNKKKVI